MVISKAKRRYTMTNAITIELDIAHDYYNTPDYHIVLSNFAVRDKLIELEGPAGGNPLIELTAPREDIIALMTEWQFDADEIEYIIDGE
jgi:hypothetical protein